MEAMKTTKIEPHKSSLGMDANIAAVFVYVAMAVVSWIPYLGWLAWALPIVFFVMEKESAFVKHQAMQALIIGILRAALAILLQIFVWILTPRDLYSALNYVAGRGWGAWVFLGALSTIIGIAITILLVYLVIMAYGYKQVELPIIAPFAAKASEKIGSLNLNATGTDAGPVNTEPKPEEAAAKVAEEATPEENEQESNE